MWITCSLFFFCLTVILHKYSKHYIKFIHNVIGRFFFVGILIGMILIIVTSLFLGNLERILASIIWYALICELYVFLFTLSLGSVSIKILKLLKDGPLSETNVASFYKPCDMVNQRLRRLEVSGLIIDKDKTYYLTEKGRKIAKISLLAHHLFHSSDKLSST